MKNTIVAVDLFAGSGGTSTGLQQAAELRGLKVNLTAINHWDVAVATHAANHPGARHVCASLDNLNPRNLFDHGQRVHVLWASPECTHHSNALGSMPVNDQSRASAMCVPRWIEALRPEEVGVENVPEFVNWGPIGRNKRPIKSRRGETFKAWLHLIESLGYRVEYRVLTAADYGDPTSRRRLIVRAVRGRRHVAWPEPTHTNDAHDMFTGHLPRWRGANEVIDFTHPSRSIYNRSKPLCTNTLDRVYAGLVKYGLKSYVVSIDQTGSEGKAHRLATMPLTTITTKARHALVQPYLVAFYGNSTAVDINEPLDTVTTRDRFGLVQPEIVQEGERYKLDIKFRMLQPKELAAAQGFPPEYVFTGSTKDVVKQIGNAVPVGMAREVCGATFDR